MQSSDTINKLACSLGLNSETPHIELAVELSEKQDGRAIKEIIDGLENKDSAIANDCIKVLYEIGERRPELISGYVSAFIQLLHSKNNRLIWGGMTALAQITRFNPEEVYAQRSTIITAYSNGSVITRDESISVFAELARADKEYEPEMFALLQHHLETCRPKEIPQHAERASIAVNEANAADFIRIILKRRDELTETQKKRIDKLLRTINNAGNYEDKHQRGIT